MNGMMMNCSGWAMAAGAIVAYGVLLLVAASCVKCFFFHKTGRWRCRGHLVKVPAAGY